MINKSYEIAISRIRRQNPNYSLDDYCTLYTDAFWKLQYEVFDDNFSAESLYEGKGSFIDEIVACLLGGFGFKAEIGWAAFERLKERNLINREIDYSSLVDALSEPFKVGKSWTHYRFPRQKSKYVYDFLHRNDLDRAPLGNDMAFRSWLLTINGIGPKTASWITRNYLQSDNVAIIDIHLYRAGVLTGFVNPELDIQKDYFVIEQCFLEYCHSLKVRPSVMDMVMWLNMKKTNKIAISLINNH